MFHKILHGFVDVSITFTTHSTSTRGHSHRFVTPLIRGTRGGTKGALSPGPQGLEGSFRFQLAIICLWCSYKHCHFITIHTIKLRSPECAMESCFPCCLYYTSACESQVLYIAGHMYVTSRFFSRSSGSASVAHFNPGSNTHFVVRI